MRSYSRNSIGALLLVVPMLMAWRALSTPMQLEPASRIWIKGTSTMKSFECQAGQIEANVTSIGPDAVAAILAGEKGIGEVDVTIAAAKLDCKNGTMNGHMLKAVKAVEHPTITFRITGYDVAASDEGMKVSMKGSLLLGGVEKEIDVIGIAKAAPEGALQIVGTHELNMKDYGLKRPSLMLGTMKVHEKLTVGFDLLLKN